MVFKLILSKEYVQANTAYGIQFGRYVNGEYIYNLNTITVDIYIYFLIKIAKRAYNWYTSTDILVHRASIVAQSVSGQQGST